MLAGRVNCHELSVSAKSRHAAAQAITFALDAGEPPEHQGQVEHLDVAVG